MAEWGQERYIACPGGCGDFLVQFQPLGIKKGHNVFHLQIRSPAQAVLGVLGRKSVFAESSFRSLRVLCTAHGKQVFVTNTTKCLTWVFRREAHAGWRVGFIGLEAAGTGV